MTPSVSAAAAAVLWAGVLGWWLGAGVGAGAGAAAGGGEYRGENPKQSLDITLWIDENQVRDFAGFPMDIFVIMDAAVLPYILDPNFEKYLPVIPGEVSEVNFTWRSPDHEYRYEFFRLKSLQPDVMRDPVLSVGARGAVPRRTRSFSVRLPCVEGGGSGLAAFQIGLKIEDARSGACLPGTPLALHLRKQCATLAGPDPLCDNKCANGGRCNADKICECPKGYMGKFCESALCYPICMNGGTCVSPGICACPDGYQGPHCEGGLCGSPCLNMGKCVGKDECLCRRGYYGERCEYSKCRGVPCLNGGRCIGINRCRCRAGHSGSQCELRDAPPPPRTGRQKRRRHRKLH